MNKFWAIVLTSTLCAAVAMAVYPRSHYHTSHKTHLGGAAYAYRPAKYHGHGYVYRKPVLHHPAPVVYAHKSYSKPRTIHYVKPAYHHQVPHAAPVYHSKPVHYLGGHGLAYKPVAHGHAASYFHKGHY